MYQLDKQHRQGSAAERIIDELFRPHFIISRVDRTQQRRGIDRIWHGRRHGQRLTVEYKCDKTAASTGNAFIELQSTDKAQGWALTSQAEWLAYYVPGDVLYLLSLRRLREKLPTWLAQYERRQIHNDGYASSGLLVPLWELVGICTHIMEVDDGSSVRDRGGSAVPQAAGA